MKNVVAVIPARGGSQSIPNKNIRDFAGKPLIAWTIACAQKAANVDRVLVSTDSAHIADVARAHGGEVPFLRPAEIAKSDTAIEPVMKHAYDWLRENENYDADALILLFPTNPLRQVAHIEDSVTQFFDTGADSVITVNESPAHYTPYWTLVREDDGAVRYFDGSDIRKGYTRRQDFPRTCYAKNDLVFVLKPQNLSGELPSLFGARPDLLVTDRIYDGDINTPEDWDITLQTFRNLAARPA